MEVKRNITSNSIIALIIAILLFFRCQPYLLWGVEDIARIIISILIPILSIRFVNLNGKNKIVFILFFTSFLIVGFVRGSDILRITNLVLLALIPVLRKNFVYDIYGYFKSIFVFTLSISLVVYLIVLVTNWESHIIIEPLNELKEYKYYQYPFLVIPTATSLFMRFHGLFDEPGVIGTIGGLILCVERFNLKKWSNLIILFAGLISFSFYFYILFAFVIVYSSSGKYRLYALLFIVIFYLATYTNSTLYGLIWYGFNINPETNTLVGMNRGEDQIKEILESNLFSKNFFFGFGYKAAEKYMDGASIYLTIFRDGFLFVFLNLLGYIVSAYIKLKNKKGKFIIFVLILLGTYYQRPALFDFVNIFLFTTMIYMFSDYKAERTKIGRIKDSIINYSK